MDPNTSLDHAHFQLTPTRTRCDLIIVAGGVNERLASGLLEPFLLHLKSAKDEISKGGYSITLRPASAHAPWFTKATLQRFVKFVSTPEVLERFVTIEKEIVQIENSIDQSNEKSNFGAEAEGSLSSVDGRFKRSTNSSKDELAGTYQNGHEENSKLRLQRVLDNRKAMLSKEQAMAYARALVAGFHPESVDDLIYFADAFGASRLREACINFLDLCKQKNEDKLWIDEIAAMQASSHPHLPYLKTSGIILAGEDDTSSKLNGFGDASISESTTSHASFDNSQDNSFPGSAQTPLADGRSQIPMSWPNHIPQYIHNFPGPFQQIPPYHGYLYPGMQVPNSHYAGNMQWPPHVEDSHIALDREMDYHKSSSKKKKKKKHSQIPELSEEDPSTASSDSSYESDSDDQHRKKHGKKSSRKVVVRNINYITSNGDGEKDGLFNEDEYMSSERRNKSSSHRQKKQHSGKNSDADSNGKKGGDNWDAFQNLLLRDDEDSPPDTEKQTMEFQEEYIVNKNVENGRSNELSHKQDMTNKSRVVSNDSFIVTERELDSEGRNRSEYFKEGKDVPFYMKKQNRTDEELLFSQRNEESDNYSVKSLSGFGPESSHIKRQKEEDWFIVNQSDKPANEDGNKNFIMFNGVSSSSEKNKKDVLADDSIMIQARSSENQFNSQSAADISLVSDIVGATEFASKTQEGSHTKTEAALNSHEPDDLFMVLDRDSAVEQSAAPWNMEMDYSNNIPLNEANRKTSDAETDKKHVSHGEGGNTKTPGVKTGKVASKEAKSKAPKASPLGKSKSDVMPRSKASPGSRTTTMKSKSEKEEESRKRKEELLIQRQKRIAERSASKKTGKETKTSLTSSAKKEKSINPSSEETKKVHKPVLRNSTIERLATARVSPKVSPSQAKSGPSPTKKPSLKANKVVPLQKTTAGTEKKKHTPKEVKSLKQKEDKKEGSPVNLGAAQSVESNNNKSGLKDIAELSSKTPSEKHTKHLISEREHALENVGQLHIDSSLPNHDHTSGGNPSRGQEVLDKLSSLRNDNKPQHVPDVVVNHAAESPSKPVMLSSVNTKVNQEIHESSAVSYKVTWKMFSTPPPSDQVMPEEPFHSRKKWNNDEDSSKAAKGFRKLLFFGRRS